MTRNGDRYPRAMLIHGARAAISKSRDKQTPLAQCVNPMEARRSMNKTVVALVNKNARIALIHRNKSMTNGFTFFNASWHHRLNGERKSSAI